MSLALCGPTGGEVVKKKLQFLLEVLSNKCCDYSGENV
jgi:hypothetical protein